jgi:hypothetical protein
VWESRTPPDNHSHDGYAGKATQALGGFSAL